MSFEQLKHFNVNKTGIHFFDCPKNVSQKNSLL